MSILIVFYQNFQKLELSIGRNFFKVPWELKLSKVNCNFHIRKLGEITAFYPMNVKVIFPWFPHDLHLFDTCFCYQFLVELIFNVCFCGAIRRFPVCRLDYSVLDKSRNPQNFCAHWPQSFILLVFLLFLFQSFFHSTLFSLRVLPLSLASPCHYLLCSDLCFLLILHSHGLLKLHGRICCIRRPKVKRPITASLGQKQFCWLRAFKD